MAYPPSGAVVPANIVQFFVWASPEQLITVDLVLEGTEEAVPVDIDRSIAGRVVLIPMSSLTVGAVYSLRLGACGFTPFERPILTYTVGPAVEPPASLTVTMSPLYRRFRPDGTSWFSFVVTTSEEGPAWLPFAQQVLTLMTPGGLAAEPSYDNGEIDVDCPGGVPNAPALPPGEILARVEATGPGGVAVGTATRTYVCSEAIEERYDAGIVEVDAASAIDAGAVDGDAGAEGRAASCSVGAARGGSGVLGPMLMLAAVVTRAARARRRP